MGTSNSFRIVHFSSPDDFIEAVQNHDDSYMNFALGALLDSMDHTQPHARRGGGPRVLLGIYRGDELLVTVTKIAKDFSWIISAPRDVKQPLDDSEVTIALRLLVSYMPSVIDPKLLDKLLGPDKLVNTFLTLWVAHMGDNGLPLRLLDPYFQSKVSYATLTTLPEPQSAFAHLTVSQTSGDDDVEALTQLYFEFSSKGPNKSTIEEARTVMKSSVELGQVWVCRVEHAVAGYILVGRFTPRTVAIRNVYVSPSHRRQGIAEAMVRAVTRYYLGATPLGFEGGPVGPPRKGTKKEICLNVASDEAERLYQRSGFMFGKKDPERGQDGWYPSCWRGVEQIIVE